MSAIVPTRGAVFYCLNCTLCLTEPTKAQLYLRGCPVHIGKRELQAKRSYILLNQLKPGIRCSVVRPLSQGRSGHVRHCRSGSRILNAREDALRFVELQRIAEAFVEPPSRQFGGCVSSQVGRRFV